MEIRKKEHIQKKKRILLSEFFTLIKRLYIFNFMPNYQIFQNKD